MRRHVGSLTLRNGAFAHWPADPAAVESLVPDRLDVATFEGDAWVSVVAVLMANVRPRGVPRRFGLSFPQRNLRTYVRRGDGDEAGVYFVTLDAPDPVGVPVARRLFGLPYHRADVAYERLNDRLAFRSRRRAHPQPAFDATFAPRGDASTATPGSLDAFLAENYRFFAGERTLYAGDIDHPPWRAREADVTVSANSMFEAHGVDPSALRRPADDPVGRTTASTDVTVGRPRVVGR